VSLGRVVLVCGIGEPFRGAQLSPLGAKMGQFSPLIVPLHSQGGGPERRESDSLEATRRFAWLIMSIGFWDWANA
jgi:hypothetical protein